MTALEIADVHAGYDDVPVLRGVHLLVEEHRLVALLGPSGCGKTTLLRAVAGFHPVAHGRIRVGDRVVESAESHVPAHRRRVAVVPQEGSLFPHLDVTANVAFGLKGRDRRDVADRVDRMLELVGLTEQRRRQPHELSGGQQQRVALARALAPEPDLVLLDEPFSSLDAQLRDQLRQDVRDMLLRERATALLITHDQQEALSLADEVAIMRDGRVRQQAGPATLYSRPADAWTARFLGDSVIVDATVLDSGGRAETVLGTIDVAGPRAARSVLLRPEQLRIGTEGVPGTVERTVFHGHDSLAHVRLADGTTVAVRTPGAAPGPGREVRLGVVGPGWLLPGSTDGEDPRL